MVLKNRTAIWDFVLMPNHIHLGLYLNDKMENFQRDFLGFTGHTILKHLKNIDDPILEKLRSTQKDREYHIWERHSKWVNIENSLILEQA